MQETKTRNSRCHTDYLPFIDKLSEATIKYSTKGYGNIASSPAIEQAAALACQNMYLDFIMNQPTPRDTSQFKNLLQGILQKFHGSKLGKDDEFYPIFKDDVAYRNYAACPAFQAMRGKLNVIIRTQLIQLEASD